MKAVVDIETSIYTKDIIHADLYPRNIMLPDVTITTIAADEQQQRSVVFVDFGDARFGRAFYSNRPSVSMARFLGTYISPLLRWHEPHARTSKFEDWIDWDWQPWLEKEYEHTASSITEEMRKKFLPDRLFQRKKLAL